MFSHESFVDHDHERRFPGIGAGKCAPAQDPDFHRLEVVRFHNQVTGPGMIAAWQGIGATDHERPITDVVGQRQRIRAPGGFDPRNSRDFFHDRVMGPNLLIQLGVSHPGQRH